MARPRGDGLPSSPEAEQAEGSRINSSATFLEMRAPRLGYEGRRAGARRLSDGAEGLQVRLSVSRTDALVHDWERRRGRSKETLGSWRGRFCSRWRPTSILRRSEGLRGVGARSGIGASRTSSSTQGRRKISATIRGAGAEAPAPEVGKAPRQHDIAERREKRDGGNSIPRRGQPDARFGVGDLQLGHQGGCRRREGEPLPARRPDGNEEPRARLV